MHIWTKSAVRWAGGILKDVRTRLALYNLIERFTKVIAAAVDRHNPYLRPIQYSQRWFAVDCRP